jgi:predicted metal-dependent hydrolase
VSNPREIVYGSVRIPYKLVRRSTRKTVGVEVFPDGSVRVLAPVGGATERIEQILAKKAQWVVAKRREFSAMGGAAATGRVVSGMSLRYLGRQYKVRVRRLASHNGPPTVAHARAGVELNAGAQVTQKALQEALDAWLRQQARSILNERLDACFPPYKRKGCPKPLLRLRSMRSRWASLSPSGTLSANPRLVHESLASIDYVLTHELCHLVHPNHGSEFYRLLTRRLPNWKLLKQRLEGS